MPDFEMDIEFGVGLQQSSLDSPTDLNLFINDRFIASWEGSDIQQLFASPAVEGRMNSLIVRVAEVAYELGRSSIKKEMKNLLGL